jgi:hypothetical protein
MNNDKTLSAKITGTMLAAYNLPRDTKRDFWRAIMNDATMTDAMKQTGIKDDQLAAYLMIQFLEVDYVIGTHLWETDEAPCPQCGQKPRRDPKLKPVEE